MLTVFLVLALSIDAFSASAAYGIQKIKIPFVGVIIISVISSAVLTASAATGNALAEFISPQLAQTLSFALLFTIGIIKLLESVLKAGIRKHSTLRSQVKFMNLKFIFEVYADPKKADIDKSSSLGVSEAVVLALALSIDSLLAGLSAGAVNYLLLTAMSLAANIGAVYLGWFVGSRAAKINCELGWVGGLLLIILAIGKLFF